MEVSYMAQLVFADWISWNPDAHDVHGGSLGPPELCQSPERAVDEEVHVGRQGHWQCRLPAIITHHQGVVGSGKQDQVAICCHWGGILQPFWRRRGKLQWLHCSRDSGIGWGWRGSGKNSTGHWCCRCPTSSRPQDSTQHCYCPLQHQGKT